ncbi:CbtA family protein [Nocardia sp. NBC_00511]|uniref:CbtA family protein n=1 Tax=Nocardia sp. NBC_00511 TaxID=2903591 RepID=UPI0030E59220
MEIRVILRGVLAGFIAGVLGFVFARIFAEPQIDKAIDYESGRDDILDALNKAAGRPVAPDGPEIFSRTIQSTIGVATGIIAFSMAMGALVAVAYLVLHGRFSIRPRTLVQLIAGFGFLGIYLIPFIKYPANPPAIGHTFTITTRGHLYLTMVGCSLLFLGLAVYLAVRLRHRLGVYYSALIAAIAFLIVLSALLAVLPSLGDLSANIAHQHEFGYARASTETPQPITDLQGNIVYPGFPADVLWKFRLYSVINQLLVWTVIGIVLGELLDRMFGTKSSRPANFAQQDQSAVQP